MTLILSALIFSLSSNLDNLVIGIAYGIKNIKIGFIPNFIIALTTSTGTFLSMYAGAYLSKFLPRKLGNSLGALVILILGVYFLTQGIIKAIKANKSKAIALKDIDDMIEFAEKSDIDKSGDIGVKEAFWVALGLTINNLGTGVAASVTGVSIGFTAIFTFILSMVTIVFGEFMGNNFLGKLFGKYAPSASGILLIILGIIEFFN